MFNPKLSQCLNCARAMERGFANRNQSLSVITVEKMREFTFISEDLNNAGIKNILPSIAAYNLSYHCPACQIYIVDYGQSLSTAQAKELAAR